MLFNSAERLPRLLTALNRLDRDRIDLTVRFLNNSPGDQAGRVIEAHGLDVPCTYQDSEEGNVGFGASHNRLARSASDDELILLLNPDTIPFHDVVVRLVAAARRRPDAGLFEAAQFPVEHPKQFDLATGETNWCCAACLMVRATVFAQLGGFDERLFLYCEDVDLSWRAWAAGWACVYVPGARCVHVSQEEDVGKDRSAEINGMHLGDLYLRRKWFDEDAVAAHLEHLRVWVGPARTDALRARLDRISPPAAAPDRPPRAVLMADHVHYAPLRW